MHSEAETTLKLFLVACILIAGFVTGVIAPRNMKSVPTSGEIVRAPSSEIPMYGDIFGLSSGGQPSSLCLRIGACPPYWISTGMSNSGCGYGAPRTASNLSPAVIDYFHERGTMVWAHICGTDGADPSPGAPCLENFYGGRTKRYIDDIFDNCPNIDGISDGEVHNWDPQSRYHWHLVNFFRDYYNYIKSIDRYEKMAEHGLPPDGRGDKYLVRFNTGTFYTFEDIMDYCDILSVEYMGGRQERFLDDAPGNWVHKYPSDRFVCAGIALSWRGNIDQAEARINQLLDAGYGKVLIAYGKGTTHPFPNIYGWWDDLLCRFQD